MRVAKRDLDRSCLNLRTFLAVVIRNARHQLFRYGWYTSSCTAQWVSGTTYAFAVRSLCLITRVALNDDGPTVRGICYAWSLSTNGQDLVTSTVRWDVISGERSVPTIRICDARSKFRAPGHDGSALSLRRLCHVYPRDIANTCFSCCTVCTEASVPAASKGS